MKTTYGAGRGSMFFAAIAACAGAIAWQPATAVDPPFYRWGDVCGYPGTIDPADWGELGNLLDATAMMVQPTRLRPSTTHPGYYEFLFQGSFTQIPGESVLLTDDSPFQGTPEMTDSGRTGFLIAPNVLVTAPHASGFNPVGWYVVFDLEVLNNSAGTDCDAPDPNLIPASNVYSITSVVANGLTTGVADYAALTLDRPATGRSFLRMRRTGVPATSDKMAMASHPARMAKKLSYDIHYVSDVVNPVTGISRHVYDRTYSNIDGASGSPMFDVSQGYVDDAVSASGGDCVKVEAAGTKQRLVDACQAFTFDPNRSINYPISLFAASLDTPELRVSPISDVTYVVPSGVASLLSPTTYTLHAPLQSSAQYVATLGSVPPGEPALLTSNRSNPFSGWLGNNASTTITVTPSVPATLGCGTYDRELAVHDSNFGFTDTMRHRFEVGLTEVTVTPSDPSAIAAVVSPSIPSNLQFDVFNPRPTSVSVTVSTPQNWLGLSLTSGGLPSGSVNFSLAPSAHRTVWATLRPAAYSLSDGDHTASLVFANGSACPVASSVERSVVFTKGTIELKGSIQSSVPSPTPAGSPISSTLSVPENFCISDTSLSIDTMFAPAYPLRLPQWGPHLQVWVDKGPAGSGQRTLQLWNGNSLVGWPIPAPTDPDDLASGAVVQPLDFNDTTNVPPTGANLNDFSGHSSSGQWGIRVADLGGTPAPFGALGNWKLRLSGTAGTCTP